MSSIDMPSKFLKDVINPWPLGADPEFAVMTPPDLVVPNTGENAVNTNKAAGAIGSDHNGRVWELRPSPSPSAYVVATNIWKLLKQEELAKLERFKWKSGALGAKKHQVNAPHTLQFWVNFYSQPQYGMNPNGVQLAAQQALQHEQQLQNTIQADTAIDTLGGHVHFGIANLNGPQRKALDNITTGLLNLDVLPQKENTKRLSLTSHGSIKYGHFNGGDATRDCNGHVEYRCPPSWLDKPGQALACLTAYKLGAARPSSVEWPEGFGLKAGFTDWLTELASVDVDAWILSRFIESRGFEEVQADPASDFKPRWRRENPWER